MRIVLRVILVFAVIYAGLLGALAIAMRQPPDIFGAIMSKMHNVAFMVLPFQPLWMNARAGHLHPGDLAPDFSLKTPDGSAEVRLSGFRGKKPVVLIFGSYT